MLISAVVGVMALRANNLNRQFKLGRGAGQPGSSMKGEE
jgi:hypothetical protein